MIILMLILTYGTKNISISDYNNESLYILFFPLYLKKMLLQMKMLLTIILKIPYYMVEVIIVLMVLLLVLKVAQSCIHHTCGGGHVQCASLHSSGGLNFLSSFPKGLAGSHFLQVVCWERGDNFFQGGCGFYIKNKLKFEIFDNKKRL